MISHGSAPTTNKGFEIKTAESEITATTNDGVALDLKQLPTDIDDLIYFLTKNVAVTPKN